MRKDPESGEWRRSEEHEEWERVQQPRFNSVTYGRDSFSYQGAKEWNGLDNFIKDAASLNDFKMCKSRHGTVNSATVVTAMFVF